MRILNLLAGTNSGEPKKPSALDVFTEQIVDSLIVAGISGVSVLLAAPSDSPLPIRAATLAFIITMLVKLKEYRKL